MKTDVLVVGAGFSGSVIAERLASQHDLRIRILEKRPHLGGNCFDVTDDHGILIHRYGPHLFHTSSERVFEYLSEFTQWHDYRHEVFASVDGKLLPLPFNLNSVHLAFEPAKAARTERALLQEFGPEARVPILQLREHTNPDIRDLAEFVYEKVFVNYTAKQWACRPDQIAPEVTARVPVVVSRTNGYFNDPHQCMPRDGFTKLFERMLDHPNIAVEFGVDATAQLALDESSGTIWFRGEPFAGPVIYTGMIDELFEHRFGELPYRSLKFQFENHQREFYQSNSVINYPNDHDFTRITEFKHITGQQADSTTVVKEFPGVYQRSNLDYDVPYYPTLRDQSRAVYAKYCELVSRFPTLWLVGRLAQFRYLDMDDSVEQALLMFDELSQRLDESGE